MPKLTTCEKTLCALRRAELEGIQLLSEVAVVGLPIIEYPSQERTFDRLTQSVGYGYRLTPSGRALADELLAAGTHDEAVYVGYLAMREFIGELVRRYDAWEPPVGINLVESARDLLARLDKVDHDA